MRRTKCEVSRYYRPVRYESPALRTDVRIGSTATTAAEIVTRWLEGSPKPFCSSRSRSPDSEPHGSLRDFAIRTLFVGWRHTAARVLRRAFYDEPREGLKLIVIFWTKAKGRQPPEDGVAAINKGFRGRRVRTVSRFLHSFFPSVRISRPNVRTKPCAAGQPGLNRSRNRLCFVISYKIVRFYRSRLLFRFGRARSSKSRRPQMEDVFVLVGRRPAVISRRTNISSNHRRQLQQT